MLSYCSRLKKTRLIRRLLEVWVFSDVPITNTYVTKITDADTNIYFMVK